MDLLRFSTAGNVDDGKSTLIGRLLYDTKSIPDDQLAATQNASEKLGGATLNLALLTDGLRAERERGITIDVAYRYFSTTRRKFIIADTPGHFEFTRNMVTGASRSDVSVVIVDALRGVTSQTKRHALISEFLGIERIIFCVNKLDLLDYRSESYSVIENELRDTLGPHLTAALSFIPISALYGENVVDKTDKMPWYLGNSLLKELEEVVVHSNLESLPGRFSVQLSRTLESGTLCAGTLASGKLRVGDRVLVEPRSAETTVKKIIGTRGPQTEAHAGEALQLLLDTPVVRGDLLCNRQARPRISDLVPAKLCWLHENDLVLGQEFIAQFQTREIKCRLESISREIDIETMTEKHGTDRMKTNGLAYVNIRLAEPIAYDPYSAHKSSGSFILIDPHHYATLGAGMAT